MSARIVVIGGGIAGLSSAILLAREGHQVTVLERDPAPPPKPSEAWTAWERRGVNQFRLPHLFLPRFRELLDAELFDVAEACLTVDGAPIATGVVAVGDAAACTNPSVGRGASIALLHATCQRDIVRKVGLTDAAEFARRRHEASAATAEPFVTDTLTYDRHRLAEIDAQIAGDPYETDDPAWNLGQALRAGASRDPGLLRAGLSVASVLSRGVDVLAEPGILDRVLVSGPYEPAPGPNRNELLGIVEAAS